MKICLLVVAVCCCGYGDSTLSASVAAAILLLAFLSLHLAAPVSVFWDPEGIVAPIAAVGVGLHLQGVEDTSAVGEFGMCNDHTLTWSEWWWWLFIVASFDEEAERGGAM